MSVEMEGDARGEEKGEETPGRPAPPFAPRGEVEGEVAPWRPLPLDDSPSTPPGSHVRIAQMFSRQMLNGCTAARSGTRCSESLDVEWRRRSPPRRQRRNAPGT